MKTLITAAVALADMLARENAALDTLDLAGAASLGDDKRAAIEAFVAASAHLAVAGGVGPAERQTARQVAEQLRALAAENRRLLERAIAIEGRVMGVVAKAATPAASARAGRGGTYGAAGTWSAGSTAAPVALAARA